MNSILQELRKADVPYLAKMLGLHGNISIARLIDDLFLQGQTVSYFQVTPGSANFSQTLPEAFIDGENSNSFK